MKKGQKFTLLLFRPPKELYSINSYHNYFDKFDRLYSHYFNCFVVDYDADYSEVVERIEPDLILFQFNKFQSNIVKNIKKNDSILKIGLGFIDGGDVKRGVFYRLLNEIGVEYFFSVEVTMGSLFPDLKDRMFFHPHFIDSKINRDYGLVKNIPILLTGNHDYPFYGWRAKVKKPILNNFPALWYRHPGYDPSKEIPDLLRIQGENYFKAINASHIVPTCGSFKRSLIMKHLEIPGSRACLVCEENETVKLHGFKDMENCVFATPEHIVEKINYLFENPDELKRITDNGYIFVHTNHTYIHRPQIFQLYELLKKKKSCQKIVQPDLLGDLQLVEESSSRETINIQVSDEIQWIKQIDRDIINRNYSQAESECKRIIGIADYIHDAKLRLYLIHMLNGRIRYAATTLHGLIKHSAKYPVIIDPIDHALLIIHLLAEKLIEKAIYYSKVGISKRRRETDYARLLAFKIGGEKKLFNLLEYEMKKKVERKDIRTIYYFYTDEFNFFEILEKVVRKNVITKSTNYYRFEELMRNNRELNDSMTELKKFEVSFINEILLEDLKSIDTNIPMSEKVKRKVQDGINKMMA